MNSRVFAPEGTDYAWDFNPHYSPEKCGLELVASIEGGAAYEFDDIIVVRDLETGGLYAAHDSGCSCPTPFEDFKGLGDFTPIRSEKDFAQFVKANGGDETYKDWSASAVLDAGRKVREALR